MNQKLFTIIIFVVMFMCACTKDVQKSNQDIVGNWIWESSVSSGNFQMLPNNTSAIYSLQLNNNGSFTNHSSCIIGASAEGTYQIQSLNGSKVIILKSENYQSDTLKFLLTGNSLVLTETSNGYWWSHHFSKN